MIGLLLVDSDQVIPSSLNQTSFLAALFSSAPPIIQILSLNTVEVCKLLFVNGADSVAWLHVIPSSLNQTSLSSSHYFHQSHRLPRFCYRIPQRSVENVYLNGATLVASSQKIPSSLNHTSFIKPLAPSPPITQILLSKTTDVWKYLSGN